MSPARLRLAPDWHKVLTRAWSVRLIAAAALLQGAEVALPLVGYRLPLTDLQFAALSLVITASAFAARLTAQRDFHPEMQHEARADG